MAITEQGERHRAAATVQLACSECAKDQTKQEQVKGGMGVALWMADPLHLPGAPAVQA